MIAGVISALSALAWSVAAIFMTPRFLEILTFSSDTKRALVEGHAVYIGAFGGVAVASLLINSANGYVVLAGFWLGIGSVRLASLIINGGWDGLSIGSMAFELTAGFLALVPWLLDR